MTWHEPVVELLRFQTGAFRCSYVAAEIASLTYRIIVDLTPRAYEALLMRGWRRFGTEFFRPTCPACTKCRSLRVKLREFAPSRSQRRTLQRNRDIEVIVQPPGVTDDHVRLYNAYHGYMQQHRNWRAQSHTLSTYYENFLAGDWPFAREFLYYDGTRLVGVALADITPEALSSIYFFHDPAWRPHAPGVFSVLQQINHARALGLRYQYLGYWIPECPSMAYKCNYRPHQILLGAPHDDETPAWVDADTVPEQ